MWGSSLFAMALNAVRGVDVGMVAYPTPRQLFDVRDQAVATVKVKGKRKVYTPRHRLWTSVTGICLHQTACVLGERPERWETCGAHIGITRSGKVIHIHDFDRIVYHGNLFNDHTVGIEVDGLYAGIEGDLSTVWDDPDTAIRERGMILTSESVRSTLEAIRWIYGEVAKRGGKVRALVAHRQASDTRRNDPGSDIWQRIAQPAKRELGLRDGGEADPKFCIGDGYPIPEAWDPTRKGIKY